ncbi:40s ribosomal protein SA [Striga asiatica]|uniref:40s ribosomal protein SA n=1 Tax=Striga asiatica TaxID=4170 RepID=A0A5A7NW07_STRAF|nr:40s ribosomal protein SA [Striga asiatica]
MRTHRFAGWAALALLWAFALLTVSYNPRTESYRDEFGSRLVRSQEFWFTLATTVLIIVSWLTVRKVKVQVTSPSGHAAIIKFEGGVKFGILGRISPSSFSEWHAFGIVSDGKKEHMMLAGAVGDFTMSLGFVGGDWVGICVFLSFLLQPSTAEVCVLWVTKGVEDKGSGRELRSGDKGVDERGYEGRKGYRAQHGRDGAAERG